MASASEYQFAIEFSYSDDISIPNEQLNGPLFLWQPTNGYTELEYDGSVDALEFYVVHNHGMDLPDGEEVPIEVSYKDTLMVRTSNHSESSSGWVEVGSYFNSFASQSIWNYINYGLAESPVRARIPFTGTHHIKVLGKIVSDQLVVTFVHAQQGIIGDPIAWNLAKVPVSVEPSVNPRFCIGWEDGQDLNSWCPYSYDEVRIKHIYSDIAEDSLEVPPYPTIQAIGS
jgi:hypothetical protein